MNIVNSKKYHISFTDNICQYMIEHVKDRLARIRSYLHMCRYSRAVEQWNGLSTVFDSLEESGIDLKADAVMKMNLQQEIDLARQILMMVDGEKICKDEGNASLQKSMKYVNGEKMWKKSSDKPEKKEMQEGRNIESVEDKKIGKWNKKKQTKSTSVVFQKPVKNEQKTDEKVPIKSQLNKVVEQSIQEITGMKLQQDQQQILQREVILPINLPQFFKKKQPHRLIICYFQKCSHLLAKLSHELSPRKQVIQLDSIDTWTQNNIKNVIQIYVAPFQNNRVESIAQIMEGNDKNIVVLYSGIKQKVVTEKLAGVRKLDFSLLFEN